jgi:hypothetical protein
MAAGLGFKDFVTGEVLTAADVDGYLMQGVWVFASATARDAAVTSPQEGNFAYLKDTNVTTYYTGSAWANLDTTGMTNPMTTTGDTIYSSPGSTPVRLGIGSTGDVLTVAGGVPTWAAPAGGGGMTLLSTTTLSGSSVTLSSINQTYTNLVFFCYNLSTSANSAIKFAPNGSTNISDSVYTIAENTTESMWSANADIIYLAGPIDYAAGGNNNASVFTFFNYTNTSASVKNFSMSGRAINSSSQKATIIGGGGVNTASAITSMNIAPNAGTFTGTVLMYGVK